MKSYRVEDMGLETTRQRQRTAENEQELNHVKNDFDSLRTYVSTLVNVRENLFPSKKQFETMEKIFDRKKPRSRRTSQLETEKAQKEAEVQKAIEENVRLHAMVDKKDVQLQAMSEQCKFMDLNHPNWWKTGTPDKKPALVQLMSLTVTLPLQRKIHYIPGCPK